MNFAVGVWTPWPPPPSRSAHGIWNGYGRLCRHQQRNCFRRSLTDDHIDAVNNNDESNDDDSTLVDHEPPADVSITKKQVQV